MSVTSEDLNGKVALISGGAGAIGAATALKLAACGAKVVIADLPGANAEQLAETMRQEDLAVSAYVLDLADETSIRELIAHTIRTFGRLDVLDNNAAMKGLREDTDVMSMSAEVWDQVMGVNARGTMLMCKYALPAMIAGGGGSIINISSGTSLAGDVFQTAYAVSKGAINTLTRYVATQCGKQGVRCNALLVGSVLTPPMQRALPEPMRDIITAHKLPGRLGEPEDIAEMVSFLASDRAAWITGQTWSVDGGFFAHSPTTPQFAALRA
ncbi:SDR family NAD(P)-dependent oxidoreductase [Cupriavidus sp. D39]|uniref:SDR family NAD(P)-dependent oxidoreductase n=1 Tax=Cupriavidus sp. D39 TaxID=2997877 RepID=UPI002271A9C8|nr:SDR family NAD(P)-dependent oxidoreductase [Cupriavidus sp. D39]MCY0853717.1 SDR family NAD(P)-dependent oxidoreductase [Cupriavidus sp. D39]